MMAKINSLIIHQTLNYDKTGKMKIESGVYGMKPIKRLSGDIAYTQKQVIPSCLLTRGDDLFIDVGKEGGRITTELMHSFINKELYSSG